MGKTGSQIALQENRYDYIDFLKACSAVIIMVYHYPSLIAYENLREMYPLNPFMDILKGVYTNGHIIVELFFILSGFLLSKKYKSKDNTIESLGCFIGKKIIRLYPVYFLTTILCSVLQFYSLQKTGSAVLNLNFNLNTFWLDLFLMRGGIISAAVPLNVPAWFLSPLFVCYFLFWVIFHRRNNARGGGEPLLACGGLMLLGITILYNGWNTAIFNERMGRGLNAFFAGALLGVYDYKEKRKFLLCNYVLFILSITLMAMNHSGNRYIPACFMLLTFLCILDNLKIAHSFVKHIYLIYKPIHKLSYVIFLTHYPVLTAIAIFNRIFDIAKYYGEYWFFGFYICCSILLALLIKKLEKPTQMFFKGLLNQ